MSGLQRLKKSRRQKKKYKEYFRQTAQLLQKQAAVYDLWADDAIQKQSLKEAERCNQALYKDILGEAYQTSYANPDYAVEQLGEEFGQLLCAYLAYIRRETGAAFSWGSDAAYDPDGTVCRKFYNRF